MRRCKGCDVSMEGRPTRRAYCGNPCRLSHQKRHYWQKKHRSRERAIVMVEGGSR